ncbi:MAG: T9SS type A sorting domain-containing protein [Chitinophagales bacterium]|nr:T9SS type A sorting domain-containing protein [Chitinophagales bacterium]MDW8417881.1 T9SS type A sorting domain-containing protein [Chitinophagales bacterium]
MNTLQYTIFIIFCSCIPILTSAQPTLTASQITPQPGETHPLRYFSGGQPGGGGNNKTWSFLPPAITLDDSTSYDVVTLSQTPFSGQVSNVDILYNFEDFEYEFYKTGDTFSMTGYGIYQGVAQIYIYSDPKDLLRFPLNMGTDYTDSYYMNYTSSLFSFIDSGKIRVFVDGWGTVITPAGTFTNALRVVRVDSLFSKYVGFSGPDFVLVKTYEWYVANLHLPVIQIDSVWVDGQLDDVYGQYYNGHYNPTSVNDLPFSLYVFPNPAASVVYVQSSENNLSYITLMDLAGREVMHTTIHELPAAIPLTGLSGGIYILSCFDEDRRKLRDVKLVIRN